MDGTKSGVQKPSGQGSRLIISHAGGEKGWVNGAELVFMYKYKSTADYHDEMNSENFKEWFHDTRLPKLEPHKLQWIVLLTEIKIGRAHV